MKKIGIDARLINQTGVGRYIKNLLFFLPKSEKFTFYIYLLEEDFNTVYFEDKKFIKQEASFKWHTLGEQIKFLKALLDDRLDLMHFTYFSYPYFYNRPFIITIHDLTPYFFKTGRSSTKNFLIYNLKHLFYKALIRRAIFQSSAVITPSYVVKKQLLDTFCQDEDKIITTYEGVDANLKTAQENSRLKDKFKKPFFLYVGNLYPHKNIERLIKVFQSIKGFDLVLVGKKDYFAKRTKRLVEELKLTGKIKFFFDAKNQDLVFFYQNTKALIHPSLSEGLGLPLLEAAYFDCPIIASDIPVFSEVLDDKFVKFNPYDVEDMRKKITSFIKKRKTFDLKDQIGRFSFKKMANQTFNIYTTVLKSL